MFQPADPHTILALLRVEADRHWSAAEIALLTGDLASAAHHEIVHDSLALSPPSR